MGRETRILLALLGLLAGVFVGVVSLKLFVPRPPEGTGPDVHGDIAAAASQELVEPPALAPPSVAEPPASRSAGDEAYADRSSRFAGDARATEPIRDPFVSPASFRAEAAAGPPADSLPASPNALAAAPGAEPHRASQPIRPSPPAPPRFEPVASPAPVAEAGPVGATPAGATPGYVTVAGDSWWSLAERAYGDGRLYRALFAWNRSLDARVSLVPGTRLELPPAARLAAAWPALMPRN